MLAESAATGHELEGHVHQDLSDLLPVRLRIATVTAVVVGWAADLRPQEKPGSSASPATQDAIAGAKKDFESINSARDAALFPKGELPRITVPEMSALSPATPVSPGTKPKVPPRAKSPS